MRGGQLTPHLPVLYMSSWTMLIKHEQTKEALQTVHKFRNFFACVSYRENLLQQVSASFKSHNALIMKLSNTIIAASFNKAEAY